MKRSTGARHGNASVRVAPLVLGILLLSGFLCIGWGGSNTAPVENTDKRSVIEQSQTSPTAPDSFKSRRDLPSCGEVKLKQGGEVPKKHFKCMRTAAAGEGAELTVARPTVEGDIIVTYYRVGPSISGVELFTDSTRDEFGEQSWKRVSCASSPQSLPDLSNCG